MTACRIGSGHSLMAVIMPKTMGNDHLYCYGWRNAGKIEMLRFDGHLIVAGELSRGEYYLPRIHVSISEESEI